MSRSFLPLLLVTLLAFLVPLVLSRLRVVPIVVGEILTGIIIGPSLLGWVDPNEHTLALLSDIGFAFLMFLAGMEIDFSFLSAFSSQKRRLVENPLVLASATFVLTLLGAFGVAEVFKQTDFISEPWLMTLILSTTSLGVIVPVLKERRLLASPLGQTLLIAALLADFMTMFLITGYVMVHTRGISLEILLILLLFVPLFGTYAFINRYLKTSSLWTMLEELSDTTAQIKVRGALAVMMVFVVLAETLGVELILGAFLGGVLISLVNTPEDESIRQKLDSFGYGFFLPIFFIDVGAQFDLHALLTDGRAWLFAFIMLGTAFLIKLFATLPLRHTFSWRETFASGILLSARLSLIIAASSIGLRLGLIDDTINASIVLTAVMTTTFAPLLFNTILPHQATVKEAITIIVGSTNLALKVGHYLTAYKDKVRFFVQDPREAQRIREAQFALCTDSDHSSLSRVLENLAKNTHIQALIALESDDDLNLEVCHQGIMHGIGNIITYTNEPSRIQEYRALNVRVMAPALFQPALLGLMARTPTIFDLFTTTTDDKDIREIPLENPALDGILLRHFPWPPDTLVLTITRDDELIIPHGKIRLQLHDRLNIAGTLDSLERVTLHLMDQTGNLSIER